ncbi:hypothetical protein ERX37_08425 [Macrococcus hajekii]|uniref:Uncharacterized protein n=1 Tax=Macrococcus hajekii TaxID=198482 RepID=A0A4R6BJ34_9STAP|nr:hypothetical protein [Macrococcus hajekii]TDM01511.1 hypothetical protein ERX37_08425 [Macrococcus hajekii]GGB00574.1 hypothetical protein GCM10007190_05840 [Macrococcus hajekii]
MIITLLLIIGLSVWIYYCNQSVIAMLKSGNKKNALIWLYTAMFSAVLIVGVIIYSMREELMSLLNMFYHH